MDKKIYDNYIEILRQELVPALGCTEPIAIAFAAATARDVLGSMPEKIHVGCSGNIIKNAQGVTVPNSKGLKGIEVAAVLGTVGGVAEMGLKVLSCITEKDIERAKELLKSNFCSCSLVQDFDNLYILINAESKGNIVSIEIVNEHTNITRVTKNGEELLAQNSLKREQVDKSLLNVKDIIEFANCLKIDDVKDVLERQIEMNEKISEEGLSGNYGISVGRALMSRYDKSDVRIRAKAKASAASDARMSGCSLPVVINSGSGNQGITVSIPVIEYAREMQASDEKLYRALALANLIAFLQKRYIGTMSAFCGAVCAAAGAASGIAYLYGGGYEEISNTIINTLASVGGMMCDGAKPSCAYKIAVALDAALLGFQIGALERKTFCSGEGLVKEDVEKTISSVGRMGREGMKLTDIEIINIMFEKNQ
jgi:L-cysteine desulfidase